MRDVDIAVVPCHGAAGADDASVSSPSMPIKDIAVPLHVDDGAAYVVDESSFIVCRAASSWGNGWNSASGEDGVSMEANLAAARALLRAHFEVGIRLPVKGPCPARIFLACTHDGLTPPRLGALEPVPSHMTEHWCLFYGAEAFQQRIGIHSTFRTVVYPVSAEVQWLPYAVTMSPQLRELVIPSSVVRIGTHIAADNSSLSSLDLSRLTRLEVIGDSFGAESRFLQALRLPRSCNRLGRIGNSFLQLTAVTRVDLSCAAQLREIGNCAFAQCKFLTTVTLPPSVEEIGSEFCRECSTLTECSFAALERLTTIGPHCFAGTGMKRVVLAAAATVDRSALKAVPFVVKLAPQEPDVAEPTLSDVWDWSDDDDED
jgi:hypothetical protein